MAVNALSLNWLWILGDALNYEKPLYGYFWDDYIFLVDKCEVGKLFIKEIEVFLSAFEKSIGKLKPTSFVLCNNIWWSKKT
jgi:hypothetical protein